MSGTAAAVVAFASAVDHGLGATSLGLSEAVLHSAAALVDCIHILQESNLQIRSYFAYQHDRGSAMRLVRQMKNSMSIEEHHPVV